VSGVILAPVKLRGRVFSVEELATIKWIVDSSPGESRSALSMRICEALDWRQTNGRLKDRSCRDALAKLHERGFLQLPPRRLIPRPRLPICITERTAPRPAFTPLPRELHADSFSVVSDKEDGRLWNEYVERYHYLGYGVPVGPNIKYFVHWRGELVACMAFSGAAWKVAVRDRWIGWSHEQREQRLHLIVNNTRFLILPWIQVKNLASRLLGLAARRLPHDWLRKYSYHPVLLETFVHVDRHAGTCYRAANWQCLGQTDGRGRMDRRKQRALPHKSIFVYPLGANIDGLRPVDDEVVPNPSGDN
jgi:Druantia protein DruA